MREAVRYASVGGTITFSVAGIITLAGGEMLITKNLTITGPANIATLANNGGPTLTHALLAGRPTLNAGGNALIPGSVTTDQRGSAWVESGTVDTGAF